MRKKHVMLGVVTLLVGTLVCLSVYADKGEGKADKGEGKADKGEGKTVLPAPVKAAVESRYPQAKIEKMKIEEEGLDVYEIEVTQNGLELEVTIAPDGTIVEEEGEIKVDNLPDAIKTALGGAKVEEAKSEVEYYVVTLTKLAEPRVTYKVELKQNGSETETEFAPDGTVLKQKVEQDNQGDDDNDDEGDDEKDDD